MRVLAFTAILLTGLLVSGCADKAGPEQAGAAREGSASLRILVVDPAIRPMPDVTVAVQGTGQALENLTGPDGLVAFAGLAPGVYVVSASRAGYFPVQTTATLASDVEPAIVKLVLDPDAATLPYVQTHLAEGFIECSTQAMQVCGIPNAVSYVTCLEYDVCAGNVTNGRYFGEMHVSSNATLLQFELVWTPTTTSAERLELMILTYGETCKDPIADTFIHIVDGPSPLLLKMPTIDVAEWRIGGPCFIRWQVFPGGIEGTPCVDQQPPFNAEVCVGFAAQQPFRVVMHEFHGYLPPEPWRFSSDGDPPAPPSILSS